MTFSRRFSRVALAFLILAAPTSVLNINPAHAANTMSIDGTPGTAIGSYLGNGSLAATVITTKTNNILIAYVGWESGGTSTANSQSSSVVSTTTPALTWNLRTRYQNGGDQTQEIWWAVAPAAGSHGFRVNWTSQAIDDASLILFAVNGANTTSPWEGASATKVPMGSISGSYSTTYANTFILTFYANEKSTTVTNPIPAGVSNAIANANNGGAAWWEYIYVAGAAVSSPVTNQTWGWGGTAGSGGTAFAAVIIDALRDANYLSINSISILVGSSAIYRGSTTIQATIPDAPGRVTFYARGKTIAGCKGMKVSGSNSVTCNWKPSVHGTASVYAVYRSDGGQTLTSPASNVSVSTRQSTS